MATGRVIRWSIVGAGIAGRARAKAIVRDPRSRLVALYRGRFADEIEAPVVPDLQTAIERCDALAICSPDAAHAEQAEAGLLARRHVVVEFPLAMSAPRAKRLFELARARQRVLHVEHIELLDAVCQALGAHLRPEWVQSIHCAFERQGPEGADTAHLAHSNVARIHRIVAAAGEIASIDAIDHTPGRLGCTLGLASGAKATAVFQQAGYFTRRTELVVNTVGGDTWRQENSALSRNRSPQTLLGMGGLFIRDHEDAVSQILDGKTSYVSVVRVLHVLQVVDRLAAGTVGPL